ncbi:hypothetical protein M2350_002959 [Candidatus Fervidibacter sacchari]|jgi:hypothetical protein|uniref:Uncharacterized protein n=1 Tax=Candidatus Fervidibacter sacchari TaxID=1448929 RepID=A0ABT2EUD8_9BACT|nr:hypothetical protein [Candidatus Fervidibacter sacchari]
MEKLTEECGITVEDVMAAMSYAAAIVANENHFM